MNISFFTLVLIKGPRRVLSSNGLFTKAQRQSIPQSTDTRVGGNKFSCFLLHIEERKVEGYQMPITPLITPPAVASSISLFIT